MKLRIAFLAITAAALVLTGCSEDASNPVQLDTTPPLAPVMLGARGDNGSVGVWWEANTEVDLAGYNVYQNTGGQASRMNHVVIDHNYFSGQIDHNLVTVYVTAVDFTGNESSPSSSLTVKANQTDQIADTPGPSGQKIVDGVN